MVPVGSCSSGISNRGVSSSGNSNSDVSSSGTSNSDVSSSGISNSCFCSNGRSYSHGGKPLAVLLLRGSVAILLQATNFTYLVPVGASGETVNVL